MDAFISTPSFASARLTPWAFHEATRSAAAAGRLQWRRAKAGGARSVARRPRRTRLFRCRPMAASLRSGRTRVRDDAARMRSRPPWIVADVSLHAVDNQLAGTAAKITTDQSARTR